MTVTEKNLDPRSTAPRVNTLALAFQPLGIERTEGWAWQNYERVVRYLTETFQAKKLIEIGGGRDPLFGREDLAGMGAELTVNDISETELAELPKGYRTACFDIAGDLDAAEIKRSGYELAFSRMVFEHVADGQRAWKNLHEILAPGGIGLAFVPTLYAFPFVVNWLIPDKLAAKIVKLLYK
ncbi:MAG: methyltransferase domain-containing protein, partial [Pseudorhodoplanes sp.]